MEYVDKNALMERFSEVGAVGRAVRSYIKDMPAADVVSGEVYRQTVETLEQLRKEAQMRFDQMVDAEERLAAADVVPMVHGRLINADRARETAAIDLVVHHLDRQPTIDAVPVVRCKDCYNRTHDGNGKPYCLSLEMYLNKELDSFCSYGERKEGAE